jgi:hypothetical protein
MSRRRCAAPLGLLLGTMRIPSTSVLGYVLPPLPGALFGRNEGYSFQAECDLLSSFSTRVTSSGTSTLTESCVVSATRIL